MLLVPGTNDDVLAKADIPASIRLASSKPRVLLGIFSPSFRNRSERMRRRVIRQTYLQFHEQFNTTNRICSMDEAVKMEAQALDDCQMIYTYVFQDGESESKVENYQESRLGSTVKKSKEPDSILLKADNQLDTTQAMHRWMGWSSELISNGSLGKIDYVAMLNTEVFLLPGIFWNENPLFPSSQASTVAVLPASGNETCSEPKCIDKRFICISSNLLSEFSGTTSIKVSELWSKIRQGKLGESYVSLVYIKGVAPVSDESEVALYDWDQYIYSFTEFSDEQEAAIVRSSSANVTTFRGLPRILVGIFSTSKKKIERERRQIVRETFLTSFRNSKTPYRICELGEILKGMVPEEECQLAYTFVIGGSSTGPTELVETNDIKSMILENNDIHHNESDVTVLNIKENMNDGKSETWLRYALLVTQTHYFDYVAKMDTDTVAFPIPFLEKMVKWPRFPNNVRVYGGEYNIKRDGIHSDSYTKKIVGAAYMNGFLYWLSPDLIRFITDPAQCDRKMLRTKAEDMTIGNYVNSHPLPIHRERLSRKCYAHPLKEIWAFKKHWKKYLRKYGSPK
ncbi:unnamed protein product [Cylindrotheca closterium]|uniref:Hexosyltransferase n=1 Tax=Cylindrotheca closterium TaxID=2856 RepID=A0AAD2G174_9STRA|nr:unnamed protein product [Cylindrotheca closterium]